MGQLAIVNGSVYTPLRIIERGMVLIEDGTIASVGPAGAVPEGAQTVDATGKIVCPGFVDILNHGGGGGDFYDGTREAVAAACAAHGRRGTTSLYAAIGTAAMGVVWQGLDVLRECMANPPAGSQILGAQIEGVWLTPSQPGCHDPSLIHPPTAAEMDRLERYLDILKRVTIAPEIDGALGFIRRFSGQGVVVSGGHSDATYEQTCLGIEAGMTHLTHIYSAMPTVRRFTAKRTSGMVEAALVRDDVTTEMIADGRHLPTSLMRLATKCKGPEKLAIVSDATRAACMPDGVYDICGSDAVIEGGVGWTPDKTSFAGSVVTMHQEVRQVHQVVGISLFDAILMATLTPARIMGVADRKGRLALGADADVLVLDPVTIEPELVLIGGRRYDG